ncbi:MAG: leucine-rich repeat protein [Clostridia bacterium]|nr:leucine-rich repeat protein [Clostridia bacterium]
MVIEKKEFQESKNYNGELNALVSIDASDVKDGVLVIPKQVEVFDKNFGKNIENLDIRKIVFEEGSEFKYVSFGVFKDNKTIESIDFSACPLLDVICPNAFRSCEKLQSVNFSGCSKLLEIGQSAFLECANLKNVNFKGCESIDIFNRSCFEDCGITKLDLSDLKELKWICKCAFEECTDLEEVVMPKEKKLKTIDDFAFFNCKRLKSIDLRGEQNLRKIGREAFSNSSIKVFDFSGCSNLRHLGAGFAMYCNLDLVDLRDCSRIYGIDWFNETKLDTNEIYFNSDLLSFGNCKFKHYLEEGTIVKVFDKEKVMYEFEVGDSEFDKARIGSLGLIKYADKKCWHIPFSVTNVLYDTNEVNVYQKNVSKILAQAGNFKGSARQYIGLLRNLGYFGFGDLISGENKIEKKDIEAYKNLLAKDLIKHKIVKEIRSDTNKDYINRLLQEKTNKIARSYPLDVLVYEFVQNNVVNSPYKNELMHEIRCMVFSSFKDINFAQFAVRNYKEIEEKKLSQVVIRDSINRGYNVGKDGKITLSGIYNDFDKIYKNTNKQILTRSDKQRFTLEDCEFKNVYKGILEGNEKLAEMCGIAHLIQEDFEKAQEIFERGKQVKDSQVLLIDKDNEDNEFKYRVIEKDNPLGIVLGNITNCCQTITSAGSSCLEYGATMPNSCFVTLEYKGNIIGQSWVWYDEKQKLVALDNIEVPDIYNKFVNKENPQEVNDCIVRLCKNIVSTMKSNGKPVENVIIGRANTDIDLLDETCEIESDPNKMFNFNLDLNGKKCYTDINKKGQYIIYRDGKRVYKQCGGEFRQDREY